MEFKFFVLLISSVIYGIQIFEGKRGFHSFFKMWLKRTSNQLHKNSYFYHAFYLDASEI